MTALTESQESDLYDENVFNEIKNHVDIDNLSAIEEEILREPKFEITDELPPVLNTDLEDINYPANAVTIPITEEFPGMYNFEFSYCQGTSKTCVFSQFLRKIYIDMEQCLRLRFKWDPPINNLWLRTTLVYSEDQHRGDPVRRCLNHMQASTPSNQNVSEEVLKQVVRCAHPACIYEELNGHMTASVPLGTPLPGSSYVLLGFQFYCKNSCSSGMNRRATKLVFTLETEDRQVVGRRSLPVRICSCPKRDKEKEEAEATTPARVGKKRKFSTSPPVVPKVFCIPGKKILFAEKKTTLSHSNNADFNISLRLPDIGIAKEVLYDAYKVISARAARDTHIHQYYVPYLEEILRKMNSL